jgi:hypothetical protein
MKWLFILVAVMILILIIRSRRQSIVGIQAQRKHFKKLADSLHLHFQSDEYFVLLTGKWNDFNIAILPHQFEGPGALTLVYMESKIPAVDRNWIEPNVSLGRALVETNYGYEISGTQLSAEKILDAIKNVPYPYVAVTLPTRFIYSPLLPQIGWQNFVVLMALNEGRKPSPDSIRQALNSAEKIARAV